jgi:hypothetical protein
MVPSVISVVIPAKKLRDLSDLTAFNALRALEIYGIRDYYTFHWKAILAGIGHRLQDLNLIDCSSIRLHDIITLCPSLVNLSPIGNTVWPSDTPLKPQLPHFRNLINLKLANASLRPVDCRYIRYYVHLETIRLTAVNSFTVEFLREL